MGLYERGESRAAKHPNTQTTQTLWSLVAGRARPIMNPERAVQRRVAAKNQEGGEGSESKLARTNASKGGQCSGGRRVSVSGHRTGNGATTRGASAKSAYKKATAPKVERQKGNAAGSGTAGMMLLATYKVAVLRELLEDRKLDTGEKKDELRSRLLSDES